MTKRKEEQDKQRSGPKGKYAEWLEEDGLTKITAWARDGLTDVEIADKMGIAESTLNEWKKKYPEISESLKVGKEVVDIGVENSLLKRAMGYEYKETTQESILDTKTGERTLLVTKVVTKQVAPDTTAQIFWLKNRQPKKWRDKQEVEMSGELNIIKVIPPNIEEE